MTCHGLDHGNPCTCATLINAHIIPRGFARDMMGTQKQNFHVSLTNAKPTQHGVFDPNILCGPCDSHLGQFDDYGVEISRRFEADHTSLVDQFYMPNVDGDKLAKFALAVLWRASISKRPEFSKIALGPYEDMARDVLFGMKSLADMPSYELIVSRYYEVNARRLYSSPSHVTDLGVNGWGFAVSGFKFVAKLDKRRWANLPIGTANPYVVNDKNYLAGFFVKFAGSVEHRATLKMAGAQVERTRKKAARK